MVFGIGAGAVSLPWRAELQLPLVHALELAAGRLTNSERVVCALLMMSAQGELDEDGRVGDVVEFVHTNFAPVYPSQNQHLGVPDQRRWKNEGFDPQQIALLVEPRAHILRSNDPMRAFRLG